MNLGQLGINVGADPRTWMQSPKYAALANAFAVEGWCNYQLNRGTTGGKIPEPWHFSKDVCK